MAAKKPQRKWEYEVRAPMLPAGATSPMMDSRQMADWLNQMDAEGLEFVGHGQKWWHGQEIPQTWWIFRRPAK